MITGVGLVCVWVHDQEESLDFYVDKLGCKVDTDVALDGFRYVVLRTPGAPEVLLMLVEPGPPLDEATAKSIRSLMSTGYLAPGSLFTEDCHATYRELKAKGVEFIEEPSERFYGIDAAFRDPSGNHWRLTQPKAVA
jgi:catechol 2,3-dioxygenase-like lactoylglutathione lyase family enzyme